MDYIDFCKKYYATTKIPISLLLGTAGKYSTIGELFSVEPLTDTLFSQVVLIRPYIFILLKSYTDVFV